MFTHSPRIVTDGLVLYLDAGNTKSYLGSGTVWKDLSGNGNDGTLVNGVGYSNSNGGSLTFDGSDDYINLPIFSSRTNLPISVFSFVYVDVNSVRTGLWGHSGVGGNNSHFEIFNGLWRVRLGSVNNSSITSSTINKWQYVGFSCTGSNVSFYIDGNLINSWSGNTGTILGSSGNGHQIGDSNLPFRPLDGKIASTKIYFKALTSQEILQNYNATKGRYGL